MMLKSGLDFFILKSYLPLLEISANLPGQFSHPEQIFLHWAAATLKGHVGFQNSKIHFSPTFLSQKWWFQELRFYSTYSSHSRWCGAQIKHFFHLNAPSEATILNGF